MNFINIRTPLSEADIGEAERELRFSLPATVRNHFLQWRGGRQEPSFFGFPLYAVVHDVLPLRSENGSDSVLEAYRFLVMEKQFMPLGWLPFAADPGGDYFFVDCSKLNGGVSLFRVEYWPDEMERCRVDSGVGFVEFWDRLQEES